jgi:putative tricarboxylic transport membrane protein
MRIRTDLIGGAVFLIFSVILYLIIPNQIKQTYTQNQYINALIVPRMIAYLIGGFSLVLVLKSVVLKKDNVVVLEVSKELASLIFFGLMLVYLILIPILGYLISMIAMSITSLAYQKVKSIKQYIAVLIINIVVYVGFTYVLKVPLPKLF